MIITKITSDQGEAMRAVTGITGEESDNRIYIATRSGELWEFSR